MGGCEWVVGGCEGGCVWVSVWVGVSECGYV